MIVEKETVKNSGIILAKILQERSHAWTIKRKKDSSKELFSALILNYKVNYESEIKKIENCIDLFLQTLKNKGLNISDIVLTVHFTNDPNIIKNIKSNNKKELENFLKKHENTKWYENVFTFINTKGVMKRVSNRFEYQTDKKYFFFKLHSKSKL